MRRVVMFTNTYAPMVGGLERSVANAHDDLNAAGHLCRIVTPNFAETLQGESGVLRLPAIRGITRKRFSLPLPATFRIRRCMQAVEPELIHAHQPFLLGGTARRVSRRLDVPLVFTYHTFYERYAHYLPLEPERARRLVINLTTWYSNRCNLVIAPTESVREMLRRRGVHVRIEVAPSGIDRALYAAARRAPSRARFGLKPGDEVVGHLGRLTQEKNLSFLIESMVRLMAKRPHVKWLLVGEGDRLASARARFAAEGLLNRLITPGVLVGHQAAEAYAAMDAFVFASLSDTQGLVLAEAMSAGLPIVALDAPGARDCVADDVTGVLLREESSTAVFADTIDHLLEDSSKRRHFAEAARERSYLYTRSRCLSQLLDAYEHALHEHAAGKRAVDQSESLRDRAPADSLS